MWSGGEKENSPGTIIYHITPITNCVKFMIYVQITYNIKIYDRWGGIIYNGDNDQWDGTFNGKLMPRGTYSYNITIYDYKNKLFVYTGLVSLLE